MRVRCLKEWVYMLGNGDPLSKSSIEINMRWELLRKKEK